MAPSQAIGSSDRQWELFFILPNVTVPSPTPFMNEHIALCSASDPMLEQLSPTAADRAGRAMTKAFTTWFGKPYVPSCLLVNKAAPVMVRQAEVLRSFRNACALGAITAAWGKKLRDRGQWLAANSEAFFFAAHAPGKSGWITTLEGPVEGMHDDVAAFRGQPSGQLGNPSSFSLAVDRVLLRRLLQAWSSHYVVTPRDLSFRALFRSLEVAFQAARYPSDGMSSINDIGTRIGLWVSCFEVLFHPGGAGSVNKRKVQADLERVRLNNAVLRRRTYTSKWGGHDHSVTFPSYVYDELYAARNRFMHGNAVRAEDLHYRRSRARPHLLALAPVLYSLALRAYLRSIFPITDQDFMDDAFYGLSKIEKALIAVRAG